MSAASRARLVHDDVARVVPLALGVRLDAERDRRVGERGRVLVRLFGVVAKARGRGREPVRADRAAEPLHLARGLRRELLDDLVDEVPRRLVAGRERDPARRAREKSGRGAAR